MRPLDQLADEARAGRPLSLDGYAVVSDGPGIAVELDEGAMQRWAVGHSG